MLITSYHTLRSDIHVLAEFRWHYVALDEAHLIQNPKSQRAQAAKQLLARHRLALTGTPVQVRAYAD